MWRYFPMIGEKINEAVEDLRSEEAVIESSWVPKPASVQTSCSDWCFCVWDIKLWVVRFAFFLKNVESRICQMKAPLYALPWKLLQCSDFVLNEPLFWVFTFNLWNIESLSMWKQLNPNELMGQRYYISLHQHISCKPLGRRLHQLEGLAVSREFIWADRRVWERRARSGWHAVSGALQAFMVSAQESTVAL